MPQCIKYPVLCLVLKRCLVENTKGFENHHSVLGDALDLSQFEDNSFDLVLNLGPMYHLFSDEECQQAVNEAIRVTKVNGEVMSAFMTHSYIANMFMAQNGILHEHEQGKANKMEEFAHLIKSDGTTIPCPDLKFRGHTFEQFRDYFKDMPIEELKMLTSDGISCFMPSVLAGFSKKGFKTYFKRHLATCEDPSMWGQSGHMLHIARKLENQRSIDKNGIKGGIENV